MIDSEGFQVLDTPKSPDKFDIEVTLKTLRYFEMFFSDDNFSNLSICFHNTLNYIKRYHLNH